MAVILSGVEGGAWALTVASSWLQISGKGQRALFDYAQSDKPLGRLCSLGVIVSSLVTMFLFLVVFMAGFV